MRAARHLLAGAFASGLFCACLVPVDLSPLGYRCSEGGACAEGLFCVEGHCLADAGVPEVVRPLLRLQGVSGVELFAFESDETHALLAQGFRSEGVVARASTEPGPNLAPVYRLRRAENGTYLFTITAERFSAVTDYGYGEEVIAFYAYPPEGTVGVAVYRLQRNGFFRYAVGAAERDAGVAAGWQAGSAGFRLERP